VRTLTNALVFFMASVFFFSFVVPQQQLSDVIGFVAILTLVVYPAYAVLVRIFPRLQFIKWEADVARESSAKREPPPNQESHSTARGQALRLTYLSRPSARFTARPRHPCLLFEVKQTAA